MYSSSVVINKKAKIIIIFYDLKSQGNLSYYQFAKSLKSAFLCVYLENELKMILRLIRSLKLVVPNIKLKFTVSKRSQRCQTYFAVPTVRLAIVVKTKELQGKISQLKHLYDLLIHREKATI